MEIYLVLSVVGRSGSSQLAQTAREADLPLALSLPGRGTATKRHLARYGLQQSQKSVLIGLADAEKARQFTRLVRRKFLLGIPGNGLVLTAPVKSVGGGVTYDYLRQTAATEGTVPTMEFDTELIVIVANRDYADTVMDAARAAGAGGGTVVHAKGTGAELAKKFLNVSLASEKEIVLIVAKAEEKSQIMRAVVEQAGPHTRAGAIAFSLPVSESYGLHFEDDDVQSPEEGDASQA